ncbi:MAG: FAD-binding oxidoreductase [bacterium]|nr:FAD-binding oxidoreductase [bacterium]
MSESGSFAMAMAGWRDALGEGQVCTDDAVLAKYARTTLVRGTRPGCVLYPECTEQVQRIARIADTHGAVVYPISRGRNWGYGDACAPTDGVAIVDLSRMNRILEVNADLAYAVLEPGVTQQQLYDYLNENDTGLWMDCTGAGPEASLVGNTLDRGFGHTRYGDHVATTCGMEVVLADGRVLNTGYGHYAGARARHVYRYGVGPSLDGIFCQSGLGIVTKIGLWLMPKPEAFNFFYVKVDEPDRLGELVDRLRPLRLSGVLNTTIHIANDLRLLSGSRRYPFEDTGGMTPLPDDVRQRMKRESGVGAWNCAGSLTGTAGHVRASRKALRKAVGSIGTLRFVDDARLALGERVAGVLARFGVAKLLSEQLKSLRPNYDLLKGVPTDEPLRGAQWRLRKEPENPTAPPTELGCGLMWVSPVLPLTGDDAVRVMTIAEPILNEFGFEPLVTFTMISERAMVAILNAAFDEAETEEAARAGACYDALFAAMLEAGYVPYRVGLQGLPKLRAGSDVFWDVASSIKRALDPRDVIARGRYIGPLEP